MKQFFPNKLWCTHITDSTEQPIEDEWDQMYYIWVSSLQSLENFMRSEINDLDTANKITQMANIVDDKKCIHGQALHFSNK